MHTSLVLVLSLAMLGCGLIAAVVAAVALNSPASVEEAVQAKYGDHVTVQVYRRQGRLVYIDGQHLEGCKVMGANFGLDDVHIRCRYGIDPPPLTPPN